MITVGLLGGKGYMGSALLPALHAASKAEKLKLILLLRASSRGYPTDVESRIIDLEEGNVGKLREALAGLNFVISAISGRLMELQYPLVDALEGNKDLISFFPTEWATPQSQDDQKSPYLQSTAKKAALVDYARAKGVPTTPCATATTPEIIFGSPKWSGIDLKGNKLEFYPGSSRIGRGMASKEYDGAALVYLLTERTGFLANRAFSIVEHDISQDDMIAALTRIHGKKPDVTLYPHEQYEHDLQAGFMEAMAAAGKRWFGVGVEWPGERVEVPGWKAPSLEAVARRYC